MESGTVGSVFECIIISPLALESGISGFGWFEINCVTFLIFLPLLRSPATASLPRDWFAMRGVYSLPDTAPIKDSCSCCCPKSTYPTTNIQMTREANIKAAKKMLPKHCGSTI